ncbi:MAG: alpha/beta hydrolase [Desulfuromonadales bacterium]|jgi:pimeloyl-ACP methyl ester carboxylesterase
MNTTSWPQTSLVMLPGLDGTGMLFEPALSLLPETIHPCVVRYPGDRVLSLEEHVAVARGHLPEQSPFVLLAESFSGPIALQLLATPPENLIGVIFVATFARYPRPFLLDAARMMPQKLLRRLFTSTPGCRLFCLGTAHQDAVRLFQKALADAKLGVLSNRLRVLAELPPPPATTFAQPCLYLQATQDRLVPKRASSRLRQYLPQVEIRSIPGPHTILLAQPAAGARLIADFIAGLETAHV